MVNIACVWPALLVVVVFMVYVLEGYRVTGVHTEELVHSVPFRYHT